MVMGSVSVFKDFKEEKMACVLRYNAARISIWMIKVSVNRFSVLKAMEFHLVARLAIH